MKRSKLCLWRPLARSAGRACVGPGSGGALGDRLLEERGFVTWFHQCVLLQRGEGRGIETHTPSMSSEGQTMIPTLLVTAPDSLLHQLNLKHQQYHYCLK